jgi:hypothetical protein
MSVRVVLFDGEGCGDGQPQPTCVMQQGDRPQRLDRVWDWASQAHPQVRTILGDLQPHPLAFNQEHPVVEPTGRRARLRRGKPARWPLLRRLAASNQASAYRRSTDRAPLIESSPEVPARVS